MGGEGKDSGDEREKEVVCSGAHGSHLRSLGNRSPLLQEVLAAWKCRKPGRSQRARTRSPWLLQDLTLPSREEQKKEQGKKKGKKAGGSKKKRNG